ncbi:MAG: hypothetical protein ACOX3W_00590 [Christensenellaceae bacterium]|jgi:hypothetical protein
MFEILLAFLIGATPIVIIGFLGETRTGKRAAKKLDKIFFKECE